MKLSGENMKMHSERIPRSFLRGERANYSKKTSLHLGDSLQLAAGIFNRPFNLFKKTDI